MSSGLEKLIRDKIEKNLNKTDSCWLWTGTLGGGGYGTVSIKGKNYPAHRVYWSIINGRFGRLGRYDYVCHECDVPACCNPDHLYLGTPRTNTHDMVMRGRQGSQKLSPKKVVEIRALLERFNMYDTSENDIPLHITLESPHQQ